MDVPKNWPNTFLYLPIALPISFHEIFLEAFLGTGYEEDRKTVIPILEQQRVYPHMVIRVIDEVFCEEIGYEHPLFGKKEIAGHISRGVFAIENIPPNTILGEYAGIISFSLPKYPELRNGVSNPYMWEIDVHGKKMYIDGFKATNELGFINEYHGIAPAKNTVMKPIIHRGRLRFCYVTIEPVQKGQELLTDYNSIR